MLPELNLPHGSFFQLLTEGFIVARASHKAVTSDACRDRKLPTTRQADSKASSKRGDFQVAPGWPNCWTKPLCGRQTESPPLRLEVNHWPAFIAIFCQKRSCSGEKSATNEANFLGYPNRWIRPCCIFFNIQVACAYWMFPIPLDLYPELFFYGAVFFKKMQNYLRTSLFHLLRNLSNLLKCWQKRYFHNSNIHASFLKSIFTTL